VSDLHPPRGLRLPSGIHPFLVAAYAVLFVYSQNLQEVTLRDLVAPLGRALIGAGLATIAPALLLGDMRRGAIVGAALGAAFFGYGHFVTMAEDGGHGVDVVHAVVAGLLVLAVGVAIVLRRERIASITRGLDVATVLLVALVLIPIVPHELGRGVAANTVAAPTGEPHATDRDIYWLIFDRYGSTDGIRRLTGVENTLPAWLEDHEFHVAEGSYAGYGRTTLSLASAFRMDDLTDVAEGQPPGSGDLGPAYRIIEEDRVAATLRGRGYRYVHVGSWISPFRSHPLADVVVDIETETDFVAVLDDTTVLPLARDLLGSADDIDPMDHIQRERALFQFRAIDEARDLPGRTFVFAHILLPHEPYVFDAEGDYPDAHERAAPAAERYAAQLAWTNTLIMELVQSLLDGPVEDRPIIVLQADEGPLPPRYAADTARFDWSTATEDELRIKYGILSAFHLPVGEGPLPDAIGPANAFRLVFSRAFGMDLPLLPERSWTSAAWRRPWELTEVTDRLLAAPADEP
jgi:hypothetical protein